MTKQEFMAISLHAGLFCVVKNIYNQEEILELDLIKTDGTVGFEGSRYFKTCIPILHPLSDLTKPIEHNGETFVPFIELRNRHKELCSVNGIRNEIEFNLYECNNFDNTLKNTNNYLIYLKIIINIIEWHFDIAGLIEKGEAIDVNTLETNPYK